MNGNKLKIINVLIMVVVSYLMIRCTDTKYINLRCRPLSDYHKIVTVDFRTMNYVIFDSLQYRDYLLSFCDTINNSAVSGIFFVEKCYYFDKGIVLIAEKDYHKYEVVVITDATSRIVPQKYYKMRVTPYFYFKDQVYNSEVRKEIFHKHYVIYPAYILHDEGCICTADFDDIVACKDRNYPPPASMEKPNKNNN